MRILLLAMYLILTSFTVMANDIKSDDIIELEKKSQNGDVAAQVELGKIFFYLDRYRDYSKAKSLFEIAAKQGDTVALYELGLMHRYGTGVEQDFAKAKIFFERAANQGNAEAHIQLGHLYRYGQGTEQDFLKSKKHYELAALDGNFEASNQLTLLTHYCIDFKNIQKEPYHENSDIDVYLNTKSLLELAALHNQSDAMVELGERYYYAKAVKQDYLTARHYFEDAAKLGDMNAKAWLGVMYVDGNGNGVERNLINASNYFESAAMQGSATAQFELGVMYKDGLGVERDLNKALHYLTLAANQGNDNAQVELGILYKLGLGVKEDYKQAKAYFQMASTKGNRSAEYQIQIIDFYCLDYQNYSLSDWLLKNLKAQKDLEIKKTIELFASQGNADAQLALGKMYLTDARFFKIDYTKAKDYLELAANQGNAAAQYELGKMYQNGKGIERDYLKANAYYELAAKQNQAEALIAIGIQHRANKAYSKAQEYFSLAVHNGSELAKTEFDIITHFCMDEAILNNITEADLDAFKNGKNSFDIIKKINSQETTTLWDSIDQAKLGASYYTGIGISQDLTKAKYYLNLSATQGNTDALVLLGNIYEFGTPYVAETDYAKAKEYYQIAASQGNRAAKLSIQNIVIPKCLGIPSYYTRMAVQ